MGALIFKGWTSAFVGILEPDGLRALRVQVFVQVEHLVLLRKRPLQSFSYYFFASVSSIAQNFEHGKRGLLLPAYSVIFKLNFSAKIAGFIIVEIVKCAQVVFGLARSLLEAVRQVSFIVVTVAFRDLLPILSFAPNLILLMTLSHTLRTIQPQKLVVRAIQQIIGHYDIQIWFLFQAHHLLLYHILCQVLAEISFFLSIALFYT